MSEFYNGYQLLSKKDINGEDPEIYICTSNRTAGKTTFFNHYLLNNFLKNKEKFMLLYRYNYELDECANKFFKDIGGLYYPNSVMISKRIAKGVFHNLYLDEELCGYAVSINACEQIKKFSHYFNDTAVMLLDEFQSETNNYTSNEVQKVISIHTSVARGHGKMVRRVPLILVGNPVSLLNPYYTALGVTERLSDKTKFLRGEGWVLEQSKNKRANELQKESAFNRAFQTEKYTNYSAEGVYLNDLKTFIEKPEGNNKYILTLKYEGKLYGVREYPELGIVYCGKSVDNTFKLRVCVTTEDHDINYIMLKRNDLLLSVLRYYFEKGCFRFQDLQSKNAILSALSY